MNDARSPWASLIGVKKVSIAPYQGKICGEIVVTASKSFTNRALIIAGAAKGQSTLQHILKSDDSYWCISALKQLGVKVEANNETYTINGVEEWHKVNDPVYIGSGGTTGRFLTSVLAVTAKSPIDIQASDQLSSRPMNTLFNTLIDLGAVIEYKKENGHFPVTLKPMRDGKRVVEISGAKSSQFLSGLLMAAPLIDHELEINVVDGIVQSNYITVTLETMAAFGGEVEHQADYTYFKTTPARYTGTNYVIEADASTASYFLSIAAVTGGEITLSNLNAQTCQPDIRYLEVLKKLGCKITIDNRGVTLKGPEQLQGGFTANMYDCSDTALTLAAIAPFASAPIEITGVEHIRAHESDRISVMASALKKMNVPVEERRDGLYISPAIPTKAFLETHDDHRVAMALAVLGLAGNGIELDDPGCVSKTCPDFFEVLSKLGVGVTY